MNAIKALWKDGQVLLEKSVDWPDGCRLLVTEDRLPEVDFMSEAEQSDDLSSIERWVEELRELPAIAMSASEEAQMTAWRNQVKEVSLEAVRRQMQEGPP